MPYREGRNQLVDIMMCRAQRSEWLDADGNAAIAQPDATITVKLLADGVTGKTFDLTAANN